jgi:hypothetical protein
MRKVKMEGSGRLDRRQECVTLTREAIERCRSRTGLWHSPLFYHPRVPRAMMGHYNGA